jgi:hypothetical protein
VLYDLILCCATEFCVVRLNFVSYGLILCCATEFCVVRLNFVSYDLILCRGTNFVFRVNRPYYYTFWWISYSYNQRWYQQRIHTMFNSIVLWKTKKNWHNCLGSCRFPVNKIPRIKRSCILQTKFPFCYIFYFHNRYCSNSFNYWQLL